MSQTTLTSFSFWILSIVSPKKRSSKSVSGGGLSLDLSKVLQNVLSAAKLPALDSPRKLPLALEECRDGDHHWGRPSSPNISDRLG